VHLTGKFITDHSGIQSGVDKLKLKDSPKSSRHSILSSKDKRQFEEECIKRHN